jgi:hypothetical protein
MITYERAAELLEYNPDTGDLVWKEGCKQMGATDGKSAGCVYYRVKGGPKGIRISIDRRRQYAHRIAWLLHHKTLPTMQIDHINGNPCDNRMCNLRLATVSQNAMNRGLQKNNSSGFKGVNYYSKRNKWNARIKANKKYYHLGYFDTAEEAHLAYCKKAKELHGEFANLGKEINQ